MASTSTSSVQKSFKYDVFLSFRGEDTRKGFVDHLYHALDKRGIITYKDDERIEKGERINEQLIRSIEESRFYIIVFSKNYASSSWCLDELVKIMECQKMAEHTAYPVFYDVEPTEVRHQSGVVGEAFAKVVGKGKRKRTEEDADLEKEKDIERWKHALKGAADLAGWELKNTVDGHEAKLIEKIIEEISPKLHFISLNIDDSLVGMETRVSNVVSSLKLDSDDVHMIGIRGIGGGGKTTLARAVFNHISRCFESQSFVENVREGSKGSGLKELQKQILQDVLNDQKLAVKTVYDGKGMMKKMCGRKVLLVLDDMDHIDQLKALAGSPNWLKAGSRIIITTRDEQVLVAHGIHRDSIYNVNLLTNEEAIRLFSRCAFKRESPIQEYKELSRNVVHYAAGLPLTITVLGSFLCGRAIREWEDAIERLETIPEDQTLTRLELSYNALENDQKEIFLEVACILRHETKEDVVRILKSCGYNADICLSVLQQKSLITISHTYGFRMHDLIAEMGRDIVRRSYPNEPKRHSRLWIKDEIEDILLNELVSKATSIRLDYSNLHPAIIMKGLRNMKELKVLLVNNIFNISDIDEVDEYLPNALQCLHWVCYPFWYLPDTFRGERKVLNKLRSLELSHSKLRTLDLGMAPNLETLCLGGCEDFVELILPDRCPKLKYINLSGSKLRNLKLASNPHLEILDLHSCRHFVKLQIPVECLNLKFINASNSKLSAISLRTTPHLVSLDLGGCNELVDLKIPVECLSLKVLDLSGSKLTDLNLKHTPHLERLILKRCNAFVELHVPIEIPKLNFLELGGSQVIKLNLGLTPNLETLNLEGCNNFIELNMPVECSKLRFLNLSGSKLSDLNLGLTPNLEELLLAKCNDFKELHMSVVPPKLMLLELSGSKLSVQNLENLNYIIESYFTPRHEHISTHKIVKGDSKELHFVRFIKKNLVGMGTRVTNVVSSLETNSDDVRMIGIKGIGGGGKTTLATAVFDHISRWFEGVSFVENVREVSKSSLNGLKELQKKVLSDVLHDQNVVVNSVPEGKNKIKRMMVSRKVLVVLDDVDDITQLEALAGKPTWYKQGSRIIITTRDQQVLLAHGVSIIHDVNLLSDEEALCLFCRHTFKKEIPTPGYEELSSKVVDYAAGLPLTLKVLGSHLCGRTEPEWEDTIERLRTIPLEKTLRRLEISYDGLENDQKKIFLDVACLLKGMDREIAMRVLESRRFHAEIGLRVLEQKSLLTVFDSGHLEMHDHLKEMGKNIVRRSHPGEPNKHGRLWI